jgi:ADP-ribose pyrophosphatase YjhB (NUDIX family)
MSFRIGVFAIIPEANSRRILLCHRRDYDLWNLPGGRLEMGESPWQGVIREVKEETTLDAQVVRLAGVYSKPEVNELVFSFVCAVVRGVAATTEEADRVEFFDLGALPPNTMPKQVERIQDAFSNPDQIMLKVQRGKSAVTLLQEGKL